MSTQTPTEPKPVTWGFGKPFIMPPTMGQLLKARRRYENPTNQKELMMLEAVNQEIIARDSGISRIELNGIIADLESEINEKDEEITDLECEIEENEDAVKEGAQLEKENELLEATVKELRAELAAKESL